MRLTSLPTPTFAEIAKTDAWAQHAVAYLERHGTEPTVRPRRPAGIRQGRRMPEPVEGGRPARHAEVDSEPQADQARSRPRHQVVTQEHPPADRHRPRREDLRT